MFKFICCLLLSVLLWNLSGVLSVLGFVLYLLTGGYKWLLLLHRTINRDINLVRAGLITLFRTRQLIKSNTLLTDLFFKNLNKHPHESAYISADSGKTLTFQESGELILKIANFFYAAGYKRGDVIVVLLENRIEYTPICLGLSMIGVVSALINYNLRRDGLKHCISISNCKAIIFSQDLCESIKEIKDELKQDLYCLDNVSCDISKVKYLKQLIETIPALWPPRSPEISTSDPVFYMYTSGTTGLPKASIVRAEKIISLTIFGHVLLNFGPSDVIYNSLPLYHANGGLVSCHVAVNGCTCVIKNRFSASRFMEDCAKYKVTIINYIGEVCRYLLAQPKRKCEEQLRIRLASGNGLRASIWREFQERFGIKKVVEVYGSTEGNIALINTAGRVGAVGFNFIAFPFLNKAKVIKVDRDTGEMVRRKDGLAMQAMAGEQGQIVGIIDKNAMIRYDGYLDKSATKKKIAHDVFRKGDSVFLSGDIVIIDEEGYFYFQDRTGDTFRWRGENVSTNEVEGIISKAVNLIDVTVIGVEVPGEEGRAGMACFHDPQRQIDVNILQTSIQKDLPRYAQPIFLRMTSKIDLTGTFKLQKNKLRDEGFNIDLCANDDIYYLDPKEKRYLLLKEETYQNILNGILRF